MKRITRVRVGRSTAALAGALMPLSANAQAFQGLCNVYAEYLSANLQLIGFALAIWGVVVFVWWFGGGNGRGGETLAALFVFIPITAGVILAPPQILGAMGFATCWGEGDDLPANPRHDGFHGMLRSAQ